MTDLIGDLKNKAPSQYRVLVFIQQREQRGLGFPAMHTIQAVMNWKSWQSVIQVLSSLRAKGFLTSVPPTGASVEHRWHLMCRFQE